MYTVSKGPSQIVAKTRRGITQNLERLETRRDLARKLSESDNGEIISMPKPVFHSNGKKTVHQRIHQDVITPQHEEMIRYINATWSQVASSDSEPPSPTESIVGRICMDIMQTKNIIHKRDDMKRSKHNFLQENLNEQTKVVKNAKNILADLESSLHISSSLEAQLMLNAGSMAHRHNHKDARKNVALEKFEKNAKHSNLSRPPTSISNSLSTLSPASIQGQYNELAGRYQDLLNEINRETPDNDLEPIDAHNQILDLTEKIDELNETITKICCKYFVLKKRKDEQKVYYEEQVNRLRHCTEQLLGLLQNSRIEHELLTNKMMKEYSALKASQIEKVRRSKHLYQENLLLKRKLQQLSSSSFSRKSLCDSKEHEAVTKGLKIEIN